MEVILLDPEIFRHIDGLEEKIVSWNLEPGRKRLTIKNTKLWADKIVVLNDVFASNIDDATRDLFFRKAVYLTDTRFVILSDSSEAMKGYMKRIYCLSNLWRDRETRVDWALDYPPYAWTHIWFGVVVTNKSDLGKVVDLTEMPSARRFVMLEGNVSLGEKFLVPKCEICGGLGAVKVVKGVAAPWRTCYECPGRELESLEVGERLKDRRLLGGQVNMVIVPDYRKVHRQTREKLLECREEYGTTLYAPGLS